MDVGETGLSFVDALQCIFPHFDPGCSGIGKRIFGNCVEIARGNKICQMLWGCAPILSVLIDGRTHVVEIFSENSFIAGPLSDGASCNREQREYYDRVAQSLSYFHWRISLI